MKIDMFERFYKHTKPPHTIEHARLTLAWQRTQRVQPEKLGVSVSHTMSNLWSIKLCLLSGPINSEASLAVLCLKKDMHLKKYWHLWYKWLFVDYSNCWIPTHSIKMFEGVYTLSGFISKFTNFFNYKSLSSSKRKMLNAN